MSHIHLLNYAFHSLFGKPEKKNKHNLASQYASASDVTRTMERRHVSNLLSVKESICPGDKALPYDLFSSALKLLIGNKSVDCDVPSTVGC